MSKPRFEELTEEEFFRWLATELKGDRIMTGSKQQFLDNQDVLKSKRFKSPRHFYWWLMLDTPLIRVYAFFCEVRSIIRRRSKVTKDRWSNALKTIPDSVFKDQAK